MYSNNLLKSVKANAVCKAFGIKITPGAQVVQLAHNAGFDALFIDLEHGWLSLDDTTTLCNVAHLVGITPFVRVPHQCGNGFVQRVLDGGAMGVFFPHIDAPEDAQKAVAISKYPPQGCRSITGQIPLFGMRSTPPTDMIRLTNESGSTVFLMIESGAGSARADEIAQVPGVDAIVMGTQDLAVDLGVPGQLDHLSVKGALEQVSKACATHGKIFGIAGIYGNAALQEWAINTLGARFLLTQQDTSALFAAGAQAVKAVPAVKP
ncbi:Pyruvate/Phosphoenolpyruvate kinase [Niveomyces insectorum RCEF 264]|uniref:Pyruvate/Phosphoenolpyruvate kinase n=1 Tax=Niveomyces insectorum RCEF 264 TaxID=1081102 RepID=A0A167T998_9HYPO|nr:Pyruvate/Phosphoenolpyruvate kinase [Niveomyces insectorum RCEF 264]